MKNEKAFASLLENLYNMGEELDYAKQKNEEYVKEIAKLRRLVAELSKVKPSKKPSKARGPRVYTDKQGRKFIVDPNGRYQWFSDRAGAGKDGFAFSPYFRCDPPQVGLRFYTQLY